MNDNLKKIPVFLFFLIVIVIGNNKSFSQTFSYPDDCNYKGISNHYSGQIEASQGFANQKVINVYIEDDIADEWTHCDTSLQGEISNKHVRDFIIDILEKYNLQTNTKKFQYRGLIHVDDMDQGDELFPISQSSVCASLQIDQTRPFLIIANANGCIRHNNHTVNNSSDDYCDEGTFGVIRPNLCRRDAPLNPLNNDSVMILMPSDRDGKTLGSTTDMNDCDPDYAGASGIPATIKPKLGNSGKISSFAPDYYAEHIIMHELGHLIFGLNHVTDPYNTPLWDSVLNSPREMKNLSPFDRKCAPLMTPPSNFLKYVYKVRSNPTSADGDGSWSNISYIPGYTSRGFLSNGFTETSLFDFFTFYFDDHLKGYFPLSSSSLSNYSTFQIDPYPFENATQRPVILSTKELTGSNTSSRIIVNDPIVEPFAPLGQPRPAELVPVITYKSTDNPYINGLENNFKQCTLSTTPCQYPQDIRSHLPITSVWNSIENMTIFASVQTDNEKSNYGSIYLYPGFWNNSNGQTLRQRKKVDGFKTNYQSNIWNYEGTTEHPVALACAPSTSYVSGTRNCIVAWNDSGTPRGRIVYS